MAPDLGELAPGAPAGRRRARLRRAGRAARRARLHPRRHGREARRVRRPRRHPRRLPADRRAPAARRVLGRRGQRDPAASPSPTSGRCRSEIAEVHRAAVPRAAAHRRRSGPRAAELAGEHAADAAPRRDARQDRRRHPGRGHGGADPRALRGRAAAAHRRRAATARTCCSPIRRRSGPAPHDLVRTGQEFLEAVLDGRGRRRQGADRPRRVGLPRASPRSPAHARDTGPSVVDAQSSSPPTRRDVVQPGRRSRSRPTTATSPAPSPTCARTPRAAARRCSSCPAPVPRSARSSSSPRPTCRRCSPRTA